jgi:hypothetical protein
LSLFSVCDLCTSRSYGIELMDNPARYAKKLLSKSVDHISAFLSLQFCLQMSLFLLTSHFRFISSARRNGVPHAPIQLVHGDFLESSTVREAISCAGLIYMNNPKFGPQLNLQVLCTLCPLMRKGCKLVCFDTCGLDQWDGLKYNNTIRVASGEDNDDDDNDDCDAMLVMLLCRWCVLEQFCCISSRDGSNIAQPFLHSFDRVAAQVLCCVRVVCCCVVYGVCVELCVRLLRA